MQRQCFLLVISGKGGVGKSSIARALAMRLSTKVSSIRILDVDLSGPSMARLMGVKVEKVIVDNDKWIPIEIKNNKGSPIHLMSISCLLKSDSDAVIWRGPKKCAFIDKLMDSVKWPDAESNVLTIIDTPPGTSDEHIAIIDAIKKIGANVAALLVSTNHLLSICDVRRQVTFCTKMQVEIIGIVENMAGEDGELECSECHTMTGVAYVGRIPFNRSMQADFDNFKCSSACDSIADLVYNKMFLLSLCRRPSSIPISGYVINSKVIKSTQRYMVPLLKQNKTYCCNFVPFNLGNSLRRRNTTTAS
ncbi:hypothetical protein ACOME3_004000 [Neoechinorhynchus agilis]